jgi:tRNA (adenine22-N1)-methyltransferase
MGFRLSKRLAKVAAQVPAGLAFADIGTDHALLPCALVEGGCVPSAIAVDVAPGSVERARQNVAKLHEGWRACVDVRLGDGLKALRPNEVATVVIAGMGGETIRRILAQSPAQLSGLSRLVLSPNKGAEVLRRSLVKMGWRDMAGEMVRDRAHFYPVVAWERGASRWSEADYRWGRCLRANSRSGLSALLEHEHHWVGRSLAAAKEGGASLLAIEALECEMSLIEAELAR